MNALDEMAARIATEFGPGAEVSQPELSESSVRMLDNLDPASFVRHIRLGKQSALVVSVPPGWPKGGLDQERQDYLLVNRVNWLAGPGLGNSPKNLPNFIVVQLQDGHPSPERTAHVIGNDMSTVEKYPMLAGADVEHILDRIPSLDRMWTPTVPEAPSWLSSVKFGPLGPLSEVDIALAPGPGLTVLSGGNSTGKTLLLKAIEQALTSPDGSSAIEFTAPFCLSSERAHFMVRHNLPNDPPLSPDHATKMARFRRLMNYGDEAGELFMPIAMESNGFQRLERVGLALTAAASIPCPAGVWPGLLLDVPTQGVDDMRGHHLRQLIAGLARHRQIFVAVRGEAGHWTHVASEVGSEAVRVDLNEGKAVFRAPCALTSSHPAP